MTKPTKRKPTKRGRSMTVARLTRLVAWLRREADKIDRRSKPIVFCDSWTLGVRAGETHGLRRCAKELESLLKT